MEKVVVRKLKESGVNHNSKQREERRGFRENLNLEVTATCRTLRKNQKENENLKRDEKRRMLSLSQGC